MDEDIDCPHIVEAAKKVNVDVEQMRATLNNRSCNVCLRVDQLWICMECRQILCGHIALGHSTAHFRFLNHHCIFLNIESASIYCYKCDAEIEPKCHDDELNRLRQFILYNRGPSKINSERKRQTAPKTIKPRKTCFKRGSKNNKKVVMSESKNECIMNTVLQTLGDGEFKNDTPKITIKAVLPKKLIKTVKPKKKVFYKRGPRTYNKVGISNSGNNCFMNAIWQALRHLKPFIYLSKLFKATEMNRNNNNSILTRKSSFIIVEESLKLLISLVDWKKPPGHKVRDAISPATLHALVCKIKPRYKGFHQHDAHEFLMFTLDTLHSELKDEKTRLMEQNGITNENPHIPTLVSLMFHGFLLSEVCCLNCCTPSVTKDPFSDISLHIPDHKDLGAEELESRPVDLLTDCLARYIEVEELNEKNFYLCSKCESQQRSTKRFWLNYLPNILCLHLKRFRWDEFHRTKIHTYIKFPMHSLDMSLYLDNNMKNIIQQEKDTAYMFDLVAVVVHDGEGGGSGHYISYALDEKDGQWYEYNDEKVHEVDVSVVENLQAYILFYIKREIKVNIPL